MKLFAILTQAAFFATLLFSASLFAADTPAAKQSPQKAPAATAQKETVKLPAVIKINPADVDMSTTLLDSNMEKAKKTGEHIKVLSGSIANNLGSMDVAVPKLRNKMNECRNKSFSTADQKSAGCTSDMTVAVCSRLLFNACVKKEMQWANDLVGALHYNIKLMKDDLEALGKAETDILKILHNLK